MLSNLEVIGIAGALMIALAWFFEAMQIMRTKHSALDWTFGTVYFAGSLLLAVYAFSIDSVIFGVLNLMATLLALFGLFYKWNEKRHLTEKHEVKPNPARSNYHRKALAWRKNARRAKK